jgi:hypothetical protein
MPVAVEKIRYGAQDVAGAFRERTFDLPGRSSEFTKITLLLASQLLGLWALNVAGDWVEALAPNILDRPVSVSGARTKRGVN